MSKQNQWLGPEPMPEIARWLSGMLGLQWCEWAHLVWPRHCFGAFLDGNTCHTQNHHAKHQHPGSGWPMAEGTVPTENPVAITTSTWHNVGQSSWTEGTKCRPMYHHVPSITFMWIYVPERTTSGQFQPEIVTFYLFIIYNSFYLYVFTFHYYLFFLLELSQIR